MLIYNIITHKSYWRIWKNMKQNNITDFIKFWQTGGNWVVEIPTFQRPYSWQNKLINQMLLDIENIDIETEQVEKIFFGSMYFKKYKEDTGFEVYQIIDGQQRLLTIFIMFIVIKNTFNDVYRNNGLTIFNPGNNSNRIRFITRVGDDQNIIDLLSNNCDDQIRNKQSNIYKCYKIIKKFFMQRVSGFSDDDKHKYFSTFLNKLSYCELATNELDNSNDMFQVFQSINARTEKLTLKDLLNNYIVKFSNANTQILSLWENVLNNFKNKLENTLKFEYLIRYLFQYTQKKDVKINELLDVFCNEHNDAQKVYEIVKLLNEFIDYIVYFIDNDKFSILLSDKKIILGQLFFCYKEYPHTYEKFKAILFSYLVRRNICDFDSKGITNLIPQLIPDILRINNQEFNELGIKSYFNRLIGKNGEFPKDDLLEKKLISTNFYNKRNIALPILKLIEKYSYNRRDIDINNLSDATIEHVNPKDKYLCLSDSEPNETRYRINNSIGNLTLLPLPINSSLSDMNFQQKKRYYLDHGSQYSMNVYFQNVNTWGIEEIKNRSKALFEFVKELFPSIF